MSLVLSYFMIYILAAWKWGDWKNWRYYYPTILFFIIGDLLYQYLFHDYSMWEYESVGFEPDFGFLHTHLSLFIMTFKYPATVLIYLGNFPKHRIKQILYILIWVIIYGANELITLFFEGISFHNGWTFGWSTLFNLVLFILLYVHHRSPIAAWVLSIFFTIILWITFDVPVKVLK